MPQINKPLAAIILVSFCILLTAFIRPAYSPTPSFTMPWKKAGLTKQQAAAHLLDRFAFGATAGEIETVVQTGLEQWFEKQLEGKAEDNRLDTLLQPYDAINLSNEDVLKKFPRPAKVLKEAIDEGIINKDEIDKDNKKSYQGRLLVFMQQKGYRPQKELMQQFAAQKIIRAAYSHNQLQQVLTEFWFNHFNVSATKNDCAAYIPAYERESIRPNVSGKFYDLLLATAQSPAMLLYLDNFNSNVSNADQNNKQQQIQQRIDAAITETVNRDTANTKMLQTLQQNKKFRGLNENYAREIMELHTLGVDGGYTQKDVTEAARILTGWTVYPMTSYAKSSVGTKLLDKMGPEKFEKQGFVHRGDFLFAANRHDTKEKTVLGKTFPAGGGYQEGVQLLQMLAEHPSTAKFISKKLAVRFVSDNPPQSLIDKMAATYSKTGGNIKAVLLSMVSAPEFWSKTALREKTKSPFELAISAVRAVQADITNPAGLHKWIVKMGQDMYRYQAPTGFPDKGQYWINTGSLLNRMKFGLAFATQKIPGISFNLAALNQHREPESAEAALKTYCNLLLPQRNTASTIQRLTPLVNDPTINQKIETASAKKNTNTNDVMNSEETMSMPAFTGKEKKIKKENNDTVMTQTVPPDYSMLAQVVGIIIGSPEFQRR
ncbi:MAG TPA: DUF1800 domain-containing protein [Ferruginibacter sp.]|nr:DUF1800 domain-containing protein [Ferruginibacter sp.]HMP20587.1 DUF1800 domain-containing protein [Ferruginibacter sp.]